MKQVLLDVDYPDRKWKQPCLIATFGFPGVGKTTVAAKLSDQYPFVRLTTDLLRLRYGFASGPETVKAMYLVGEELLSQKHSIIFDGIHLRRKNREELLRFGMANKAQVRFIQVVADPVVIKERLNQRATNPEATRAEGKFVITDEHFQRITSYFESPDEDEDVVEVDTSSSRSLSDNQLSALYVELNRWIDKG